MVHRTTVFRRLEYADAVALRYAWILTPRYTKKDADPDVLLINIIWSPVDYVLHSNSISRTATRTCSGSPGSKPRSLLWAEAVWSWIPKTAEVLCDSTCDPHLRLETCWESQHSSTYSVGSHNIHDSGCSGASTCNLEEINVEPTSASCIFIEKKSSWDSLNWIRNQEKLGPTWHIGTKNDNGYWWLVMVSVCCHLRLLHWGLGTCVKVDALQHETTLPKQRCHRLIYTCVHTSFPASDTPQIYHTSFSYKCVLSDGTFPNLLMSFCIFCEPEVSEIAHIVSSSKASLEFPWNCVQACPGNSIVCRFVFLHCAR